MPGYKTYQTFDEFLSDQSDDKQAVIRALRRLVNETSPELTEGSKWGGGVWLMNEKLPVIFVNTHTKYVQLGFFAGALLDDPERILEGTGKFVRHTNISSVDDVDKTLLTPLITQAAKLDYKSK